MYKISFKFPLTKSMFFDIFTRKRAAELKDQFYELNFSEQDGNLCFDGELSKERYDEWLRVLNNANGFENGDMAM